MKAPPVPPIAGVLGRRSSPPDWLPVLDVSEPRLDGRAGSGTVFRHKHHPDEAEQYSSQHPPRWPDSVHEERSDDCHDRYHSDIAVEAVEHEIVVQLGGRTHGAQWIDSRFFLTVPQ